MRYPSLILATMVLVGLPAFGASSYLGGFSGNILTPDGTVLPQRQWDWSYHQITDALGNADLKAFGISYGLAENLEVGASFLNDDDSETAFNAKYRLLPETPERPTIIVGVFDAAGTADSLHDDPGVYLLLSKIITPTAARIAGRPSKPLTLSLGFGSGVFDGVFAGLDWTLQPRLSLMAEFFGGELGGEENFFNAGVRYAVSDALRLDAATVDFKDFGFGANFRVAL